jgi:hypothetical protein
MSLINDELREKLRSREWRLSHLYFIKDKQGKKVLFKPNWAQQELLKDLHNFNIILKARQLGITTLFAIFFLDMCLWNRFVNAAIVADRQSSSLSIFRDKVKFAYDNLHPALKLMSPARRDNANELSFANGSVYRVGTSLRSGTVQMLHISEFGKICREFPRKAVEIVEGAINTVQAGQFVTIESTAEGRSGAFFDMWEKATAQQVKGVPLGPLDFKPHFLSWWREPEYRMEAPAGVYPEISGDLAKYFAELSTKGIQLLPSQKYWYQKKDEVMNESVKKEYPSTPEEAFQVNTDGLYYAKHVSLARTQKRIMSIPYDRTLKVHTAWDLGFRDANSIIFFQICGRHIHIIDFLEGSGYSMADYIKLLKDKPYIYGTHLAPHDIKNFEYSWGKSRIDTAAQLGINFTVVPDLSLYDGIDATKNLFTRLCFHNSDDVLKLVKHVENYTQTWDKTLGQWSGRPNHNEDSHSSDALRYLAVGLDSCTDETQGVTQGEADGLWRTHGKKI